MKNFYYALYIVVSILILITSAYTGNKQLNYEITNQTDVDSSIAWKRNYIEGYTNSPSIQQGNNVEFKVSTLAAFVSPSGATTVTLGMKIYRVTSTNRMYTSDTQVSSEIQFSATFYPLHAFDGTSLYPGNKSKFPCEYRKGCNWSTTVSYSTANLQSGVYYAKMYKPGYEQDSVGYIPFVVRAASPGTTSKTLCVIAWNTYQAYNYWGGGSLYYDGGTFDSPDTAHTTGGVVKVIHTVSFRRPFIDFAGSNGFPLTTKLGQLDHRERAFVAWAVETNTPVEYCVDADLDANLGNFIGSYKFIVFPGHSEYWSRDERRNTEVTFKSLNNNIAFLAANNCYWRVDLFPTNTNNPDSMYCNKNQSQNWWRKQTEGPEAKFIGVQYQGNNWPGIDTSNIVVNKDHWILKGTGLQNNDRFGLGAGTNSFWTNTEPLASGESDMVRPGISPANVEVIGRRQIRNMVDTIDTQHYSEVPDHKLYSDVIYYEDDTTNSRVFAAGGFGWASSLFGIDSTRMRIITKNIFDHFNYKKYLGNIHSDQLYPLQWSNNIELDGNTTILSGKYLSIQSTKVTVDSGVIFSINGTLEINGYDTIKGQNNKWGVLAIRNGGTLHIKNGAILNLDSTLYFVIETGANLVVDNGGTLNIRTNTSTGDNLTIDVPAGGTLNFYNPGEIYFGSNSGMHIKGVLNVTGTISQRITFGPMSTSPTPGCWGSIVLDSAGASGSNLNGLFMKYGTEIKAINVPSVTIQNSRIENTINGINFYGSNGWIMWDTLKNIKDHGIIGDGGSTPSCYHNTIFKNSSWGYYQTGAGILFNAGSHDYIWNNDIKGFNWGVGTIWGSSPQFGHPNNAGVNNRITNCLYGLKIYQHSIQADVATADAQKF